MIEKNYKEFDYMSLTVKKDKYEEVISSYEIFGWKVLETKQHKSYENLLEVEISRPHFIINKAEIQFLQVNMECDLNKKGKIENQKHAKSTSFGLCFGCLGLGLIIGAILMLIKFNTALALILSVLQLVIGGSLLIFSGIALPSMVKEENENYKAKIEELDQNIADYCKKASAFLEGRHKWANLPTFNT